MKWEKARIIPRYLSRSIKGIERIKELNPIADHNHSFLGSSEGSWPSSQIEGTELCNLTSAVRGLAAPNFDRGRNVLRPPYGAKTLWLMDPHC